VGSSASSRLISSFAAGSLSAIHSCCGASLANPIEHRLGIKISDQQIDSGETPFTAIGTTRYMKHLFSDTLFVTVQTTFLT
jgi:hypothetical protein